MVAAMNAIILDIATAAHPNAPDWIEPGKAPGNYKRPEAIAAWQEEDGIERLARAGLDPDLCVVTAVGIRTPHETTVLHAQHEGEERVMLMDLAGDLRAFSAIPIVGYNVKAFDLAVLK